jgi:hypothetical protein
MPTLLAILAALRRGLKAMFAPPQPPTIPTAMPIDPITGGEEVAAGALTVAGKVLDAEAAAAARKNAPAEQQAAAQAEGLAEEERVIKDEQAAEANPTPANIKQMQEDSSGVPLP